MATKMEAAKAKIDALREDLANRAKDAERLEKESSDKALDDPDGSIEADARAQAIRRLLPKRQAELERLCREYVDARTEESRAAFDAEEERLVAEAAAEYPSLVEKLNAMVPAFKALLENPCFQRLLRRREFLSLEKWNEMMNELPKILDEWRKDDRSRIARSLQPKRDEARFAIEGEGEALLHGPEWDPWDEITQKKGATA